MGWQERYVHLKGPSADMVMAMKRVGSVTTWVPHDLARLNQEPSERGSPPNSEKGPPSPLCDKTGLVGTPQRGGPLRVLLVDVRLRKRPYSLEQGRRHPN